MLGKEQLPVGGKILFSAVRRNQAIKISHITWDLEPDTIYTSVSDKVDYVNKNVKPGSIILLHAMYDNTGSELKVIEGILEHLSKEGYEFVTINELQK